MRAKHSGQYCASFSTGLPQSGQFILGPATVPSFAWPVKGTIRKTTTQAFLGMKQPDEFGPDLLKPTSIRLPLLLHQMGELGWILPHPLISWTPSQPGWPVRVLIPSNACRN